MKIDFKIITLLFLISFSSCRKEEVEFIQAPDDEILQANSSIANLMQRTAMNDGSNDNIIDYANCFNIQLPITVVVNGTQIIVNTENDYDTIEDIFDEFDDDTDYINITYPITIVLNDFTQVTINNSTELNSYSINCNGENESDDDIECLDFQYPIIASIFNANNELLQTVTINSDFELYVFIDSIDENDIVSINFPITVTLSDNTSFTINNLNELENIIENYINDCDEDDDYDYNDDDCDNCTPSQLSTLLTQCPNWTVDKLERNNNDYDDLYDGYLFNFFIDGSISVSWSSTTVYGNWSTSGTGNNIVVVIDIPSLPYCNNNWYLHEIDEGSGETKIDLREGNNDRLRYENNCN